MVLRAKEAWGVGACHWHAFEECVLNRNMKEDLKGTSFFSAVTDSSLFFQMPFGPWRADKRWSSTANV